MHGRPSNSHESRTDALAHEAARLIETGDADSLTEAIQRAAHTLDAHDVPQPSKLQIRLHAQAMSMQALGEAGYYQRIIDMWQWTEELMTAIEYGLDNTETLLVGRAAQGHMDAGVTIHIRAYTDESMETIAETLVEYGYNDPTFETVDTKYGKMNRLRIVDEEENQQAVVLRIKHSMNIDKKHCVFTGKTIPAVDLKSLRTQIENAAKKVV